MRDLAAERNIAVVQDGLSGDVHEIYFRTPRPDELAAYQAGLFKRKGRKFQSRVAEQRMKYGAQVITGFKKGTIGVDGRSISSDPDDPDYRKDWSGLLQKHAPDIVMAVATAAFEGTGISQEAEVEDADPLDGSEESTSTGS